MRRLWSNCGMLIFSGSLLLITFYYGMQLFRVEDTMSVKYSDAALTAAQIDKLNVRAKAEGQEEGDIPYITGWDREEAVRIENTDIGRELTANLLVVYGDMTAVYPKTLLLGSFISGEDTKGCVLSSEAARKLFQSSYVRGCEVSLSGVRYVVRGVMESEEAFMMIQAEGGSKTGHGITVFPYLEFSYESRRIAASITKAELMTLGLPEYESFTEGNLYAGIARIFMALPFFILLCAAAPMVYRRWVQRESRAVWRYIKAGFSAAAFLLLLSALVKYGIVFSDDFIPARVSDFAFWPSKIRALQNDYRRMLLYAMWYKEAMILNNLKCCAAASAASGVMVLYTLLKSTGSWPADPTPYDFQKARHKDILTGGNRNIIIK